MPAQNHKVCASENATSLHGIHLMKVDPTGLQPVNAEHHLYGKVVGLYFSASWCYICHQTTRILKDFYEDIDQDNFEIVFVSRDKSPEDLAEYMEDAHGEWSFIPYGDEAIDELTEEYDVTRLPTLIIIKPSGEVITREGVEEIKKKVPTKLMSQWETTCAT
uniref:Thioredoxin domain-containing protein n=1 Tax=Trichuris muris TaxID=70415 RepID=A0A5S6R4K9_TRIMR